MMTDDNSTIATQEEESSIRDTMSFVHVAAPGGDNNGATSAAAAALSLTAIPKHATIGLGSSLTTTHVCVNIKGKEIQVDDDNARAPVDIVVALDVSGSMTYDSKLDLCKQTLEQLLSLLLPTDRFGLVSYETNARVEIPLQKMTSIHKDTALRKIRSLHPHGCTNISAAIGLATQEMNNADIDGHPNPVRSIFLLTDGHANQGVSDKAGLVELTKNCVSSLSNMDTTMTTPEAAVTMEEEEGKGTGTGLSWFGLKSNNNNNITSTAIPTVVLSSPPPITMNCFGYGADHCADLLSELSAAASGSYYFVENDTGVATAFGDALGGIFSVVAQNVVLNLTPCPGGAEIVDVMHSNTVKRENGTFSVSVGDFFAEETRDVVFKVKLSTVGGGSDAIASSPVPHVTVSMAYTDTILKCPARFGPILVSIARPNGTVVSEANAHVAAQAIRVFAAKQIEIARSQASRYDLASSRETIVNIREMIAKEDLTVQSNEWIKMILNDLDEVEKGLQSERSYASFGQYHMETRQQAFTTQRCAEATLYRQAGHANYSTAKAAVTRKMQTYPQNK